MIINYSTSAIELTLMHHMIQPDSNVGFNQIPMLDPTKNGLQNLHVFQPDFNRWIQPDSNIGFNQIPTSNPTKNGLQNPHVFQPDSNVGINQIS